MNETKKKRTQAKARLTRCCADLETIIVQVHEELDHLQVTKLEHAIRDFREKLSQYDEYQAKFELFLDDEIMENEIEMSSDYRKTKLEILLKAELYLQNQKKYDVPEAEAAENKQKMNIEAKLPKLSLPTFSGDFTEWQSFWDNFVAIIDSRTDLSIINKFSYLQSSLKEEAKSCLQGLALTQSNYEQAKEILQNRFGKRERIVASHIDKLLNISQSQTKRKELWTLYDEIQVHVRSLAALNVDGCNYGLILVPLILHQLPSGLRLQWARQSDNREGDLEFLLQFLYNEIQHREKSHAFEPPTHTREAAKKATHSKPTASALFNSNNPKSSPHCVFCNLSHYPDRCPDISALTHEQRKEKVKSLRLCFRCLRRDHFAEACNKRCYHCKGPHHSVLHINKSAAEKSSPTDPGSATCTDVSSKPGSGNVNSALYSTDQQTNRSTLMQCVKTSLAGCNNVYVLFDSGSDRSYITVDCAKRLKLNCIGEEVLTFSGFAAQQGQRNCAIYELTVKGEKLKLYGIDTICQPMFRNKVPKEIVKKLNVPILENLNEDCVVKIDILIGLDQYWSLIDDMKFIDESVVAQCTKFGWMISGSYQRGGVTNENNSALFCWVQEPTESTIRGFWELDSIGIQDGVSSKLSEGSVVLEEFSKGVSLDNNRYKVGLPWKSNDHKDMLINNEEMALRRLNSLNRKLDLNPELKENYSQVFSDLEKEGIIEEVTSLETDNPVFYLPHRPVVREDSLSTKIRPVFDASAKGPNGVSLNDCVETGPKLVPDLVEILLRFRRWKFAVVGDIQKAFLQIELNDSDRDVHRFLLGEAPDHVRHMRFNRVTFGNAASPFILNAVVKLHLSKFEESYAVSELRRNLYVDDFLSGSDSESGVAELVKETDLIMRQGSFKLTKWFSNCDGLFENKEKTISEGHTSTKKVLGVGWNSDVDSFHFGSLKEVRSVLFTKRALLGMIAQIFDPLGFLNPFTISLKILFQETWRLGIEWDAILPDVMRQSIDYWISGLELMSQLNIPRRLSCEVWTDLKNVELLVFVDASTKAYGCCVYLRSGKEDTLCVNLVISKARVAPLSDITLPRLELLAALLGARLLEFSRKALELPEDVPYTCFSDSQIVLGWIKGDCSRWKQFVRNRVSEIQKLTDPAKWRHCSGVENPADLLTRGVSADHLNAKSSVWLNGPSWLMTVSSDACSNSVDVDSEIVEDSVEEVSDNLCCIVSELSPLVDFERFSSFTKLVRVVNYVLRFIRKVRKVEHNDDDMLGAQNVVFKLIQSNNYGQELELLKSGRMIKKGSSLWSLNPFIDENGLLRVGGRLGHAPDLSYDEKYPIIVPKCHVALLLVRAQHNALKHAGVKMLISVIRDKYWIVSLRPLCKKVVNHCVVCQRYDSRLLDQSTAPLPENRVAKSPPFAIVGLDNAGPLYCSDLPDQKLYILLFTCAVTRAIHLELVDNLSSDEFCQALKRFCSRRAMPSVIYADNAKTFKGAKKILLEHFGYEIIEWRTQPALAPWWGGFYERLVRSVKAGLRKSVSTSQLSRKKLETSLIEVEACINSRPLTQTTDNDTYLTPSHFLIGRGSPLNPPELTKLDKLLDLHSLYECHTAMLNVFWETWVKEYLRSLPSSAGKKSSAKLKVGCLVLVQDEHKKRMFWNLGRVVKVYKGLDGLIRAAQVKTGTACLVRPIQRLVPLELDQTEEHSENWCTVDGDFHFENKTEDCECERLNESESEKDGSLGDSQIHRTRFGRTIRPRKVLDI